MDEKELYKLLEDLEIIRRYMLKNLERDAWQALKEAQDIVRDEITENVGKEDEWWEKPKI